MFRVYGHTCWLCGTDGADTVDHVIPLARGGPRYELWNLRPAHGRKIPGVCPGNYGRGDGTRQRQHTPPNTSRNW
jgi:5-methylcytosine-specific restriction endonuclease McrA